MIWPRCAPDDDERQGTTEWIGLIGSNNRQEIRPLPCSFALLIASTRTLIADGKNASDQLQISLSLCYNYTFLARCAIARAPGCVASLVHALSAVQMHIGLISDMKLCFLLSKVIL